MSGLAEMTGLLTGASRGIGRALALRLAAEGVHLVLSARNAETLEGVAEETAGVAIPADLAAPDGPEALAAAARERLGGTPDLVLNVAGVFRLAPVAETDRETLDRHLAVNLRAPFLLTRAFLPGMLARGSGWLVHLGSVAGRRAFPENGAYSATKYGLRGLHEVLRMELEGSGVRSLLVEPPAVDTEAWDPLESRLGADLPARAAMLRPDEVADAVVSALGGSEEPDVLSWSG